MRLVKAGAQLVIFHHDPTHDDDKMDAIAEEADRVHPGTIVAREGMLLSPDGASSDAAPSKRAFLQSEAFATICCALVPIHRQSCVGTRTGFRGSILLPPKLPSAGKLRVASVRPVPDILQA